MKIDNSQLAAFAAVLHEGSFEGAAQRLHVTPSAISQRIKLLEERLGQVLIQRGTPCTATRSGKTLLRFADQLDLLESDLLREMGVFGDDPAAGFRVPIAVNADSLDGWFLEAMENVCATSGISFDIRVEDQEYSAALLREGAVMAAVSASDALIQGCRVEFLGNMRYMALSSPRFVREYFPEGVNAGHLARATMLVFNRKDSLQQAFIDQFTDEPLSPPTHYLPSTQGFLAFTRQGLGWGMIPEDMARNEIARGELVEIAPGHTLDIPLYWHYWRFSSPILDQVSEAVRNSARHYLLEK